MVVLAHMREQFALSLGSHGRPRMTEKLKELGLHVAHPTLAARSRFPPGGYSDHDSDLFGAQVAVSHSNTSPPIRSRPPRGSRRKSGRNPYHGNWIPPPGIKGFSPPGCARPSRGLAHRHPQAPRCRGRIRFATMNRHAERSEAPAQGPAPPGLYRGHGRRQQCRHGSDANLSASTALRKRSAMSPLFHMLQDA